MLIIKGESTRALSGSCFSGFCLMALPRKIRSLWHPHGALCQKSRVATARLSPCVESFIYKMEASTCCLAAAAVKLLLLLFVHSGAMPAHLLPQKLLALLQDYGVHTALLSYHRSCLCCMFCSPQAESAGPSEVRQEHAGGWLAALTSIRAGIYGVLWSSAPVFVQAAG